jgi:DNA-binding Lrp family transcriptional regulator
MCYLRQNSRMKLTSLSRRTNIPISTIFDKLKSYASTIIAKNTCLLDFPKLGFHTKVHIMFKVNKKDKIAVKEYLQGNFNTNSLYKINNGYDFLAECIFRNIKETEEFLETVDDKFSIKSQVVHYIIDDLKRESFMSDPQIAEIMVSD